MSVHLLLYHATKIKIACNSSSRLSCFTTMSSAKYWRNHRWTLRCTSRLCGATTERMVLRRSGVAMKSSYDDNAIGIGTNGKLGAKAERYSSRWLLASWNLILKPGTISMNSTETVSHRSSRIAGIWESAKLLLAVEDCFGGNCGFGGHLGMLLTWT